jgi:hypothetical protein
MKRRLLAAGIVAAITFFAPATRAANQDFTIVNKTGKTLENIHVRGADESDWGKNLLGDEVLDPGETFKVTFTGYDKDECEFEVRVETEDTYWELEKIDLCATSKLILKLKGSKLIWSTD